MRASGPIAPTFVYARLALAPVALVALIGLAGCGEPGPSGSPSEVIGRAPDATVAAGVARVVIDQGVAHAEGVVDLGAGAVRLTVTTAVRGEAGPPTELVAVGADVWSRRAGTSRWSRRGRSDSGLLSLPGIASGDPRALVALVRGTSEIDPYGGVQVRDVSAIRYDLKTNPLLAAEAAAQAGPQGASTERSAVSPARASTEASAGASALEALAAAVDHTVWLACYVDGQGRIRRLDAPEDPRLTTPATRPDGSALVATVDFLEFGLAERISPPPVELVD